MGIYTAMYLIFVMVFIHICTPAVIKWLTQDGETKTEDHQKPEVHVHVHLAIPKDSELKEMNVETLEPPRAKNDDAENAEDESSEEDPCIILLKE